MLTVGRIIKAHGIRGDVKVECFLDSPDSFIHVKKVYIDDTLFNISKISIIGNYLLIKFDTVADMNRAEVLRNKLLYCEKEDLPNLGENRYYICDLIGCVVSDGEKDYGKIVEVLQNGSSDVIVCKKKNKIVMFPWLKILNAQIDIETKIFMVDKDKLAEVIVYEN